MKTYVCYNHDGWFLGGNSVVVAPNKNKARALLNKELKSRGLDPDKILGTRDGKKYQLVEVPENTATVVFDGDY